MILLILKKDLKLFFANKRNVIITFLIPILLISLFAFAFGGTSKKSSVSKQIELLYSNIDNSTTSHELINRLAQISQLKLTETSATNGEELLLKGKKSVLLIIDKGIDQALAEKTDLPITLKYDSTNPFEYAITSSMITNVLKQQFGTQTEQKQSFIIKKTPIIKPTTEKGNLGLIQAVAGTAIMMLLFSISGIGGSLLEEKESGTLERLLYAPIRDVDILFGKMLMALVISILQLTVMFIYAWLAFDLPIFNDLFSLILLTIAVAMAVSSFGMFLVSLAKSRQQLQNLSTIIILLMSAIGGSMVPLYVMPAIMKKLAVFSLNYWGIQGYYDIFWRSLPFSEVLPNIFVLLAITIVMVLISIPLYKKNIIALTN